MIRSSSVAVSRCACRFHVVRKNHRATRPNRDRFSSSSSSSSSSSAWSESFRFVPEPTWSIEDLRLTVPSKEDENDDDDPTAATRERTSSLNLETLARRAMIDLDSMDPDRRVSLEKDLNGMMRCVSVLEDYYENDDDDDDDDDDNRRLTDFETYDAPRGLTHATLRYATDDDDDDDDVREKQREEQSRFLKTLERKLVSVNANKNSGTDSANNNNDDDGDGQPDPKYFAVSKDMYKGQE